MIQSSKTLLIIYKSDAPTVPFLSTKLSSIIIVLYNVSLILVANLVTLTLESRGILNNSKLVPPPPCIA